MDKFNKEYRRVKVQTLIIIPVCLILMLILASGVLLNTATLPDVSVTAGANPVPKGFDYNKVPKWDKKHAFVKINKNKPYFSKKQLKSTKSYEKYGKLDKYGRCTTTIACIGTDLMPKKVRGEIGMIKPTGWHTVKYAGIDGNYLYNRCHLIGYQLTGENANNKNLITGTRYLNIEGMLPFENEIADYLRNNWNDHVLYRVTPVFIGKELVARGVLMEGQSIEDNGKSIRFCVFCYNNQPGITINYKDGSSKGPEYTGSTSETKEKTENSRSRQNDNGRHTYVLNVNTRKIHKPSCPSVSRISSDNRETVREKRKTLINRGYSPCGICKP